MPRYRSFYERLATFSRLILFDKRGTGLSDHTGAFPTLETRMEDVRAVLDAVDSRDAVVFGSQERCNMASLFAATYPERTRALILFQPAVRVLMGAEADAQRELEELRDQWGTQEFADMLLGEGAPSLLDDDAERRFFANWLRLGASPAAAYALNRMYVETDLRDVLPAVRVPTLALYRNDDMEPRARDAVGRIPNATLVRLPGRGSSVSRPSKRSRTRSNVSWPQRSDRSNRSAC
jgi:pimeloyl-ACP methyl ester carboxylesterase